MVEAGEGREYAAPVTIWEQWENVRGEGANEGAQGRLAVVEGEEGALLVPREGPELARDPALVLLPVV